jgi:hypothetical protein
MNYPETGIIAAAETVRRKNKFLATEEGLVDNDSSDYWHHIYFNFHGKMLLTWTRRVGKNMTKFAFVRIQDENSLWKDINNDFGYFKNRKLLKVLENEISEQIKIELNNSSEK